MKLEDILKLIEALDKSDVSEFKLVEKDLKINIKSKAYTEAMVSAKNKVVNTIASSPLQMAPAQAMQPMAQQGLSNQSTIPAAKEEGKNEAAAASSTIEIKSPMVGTFYRSPSPDKPTFVNVGDRIEKGQTICIVEAMKLFNEIESEVSGTIVKVLIDDASPVEYDQAIMLIDPS